MVWHNGNVIISSFDKYDLVKSIESLTKKFERERDRSKVISTIHNISNSRIFKVKRINFPTLHQTSYER